jgi:hypothetical protein
MTKQKRFPSAIHPVIVGNDDYERIKKAVEPPEEWTLTSSDGREYAIRSYSYRVAYGECVTVNIEALVHLPDEEKPE